MKSRNIIRSLIKKQSLFKHPDIGIIKETLLVSDYLLHRTERSQIDSTTTITLTVGMKCPHCGIKIDEIPHGCTVYCMKCGLKMTVGGNALRCELDMDGPDYASKD